MSKVFAITNDTSQFLERVNNRLTGADGKIIKAV